MASEADVIGDEERARIVCDFISQTPPGEFDNVLNDVRRLLDNDSLLQSNCSDAIMRYHIDQMTQVDVQGEKVLLSGHGATDDGNFQAPNSKAVFAYEPMKGEAKNIQPGASGDSSKLDGYRKSLLTRLDEYVKDHYKTGTCTVYTKPGDSSDEFRVVILIQSHHFAQNNYMTGSWRSEWTGNVLESSGSMQLSGSIKVHVHYFEDGNVQLISSKTGEVGVRFQGESGLADAVCDKIAQMEAEYQNEISSTYSTFSLSTFKMLRRALPMTHAKINWDQLAALKIGAELKNI